MERTESRTALSVGENSSARTTSAKDLLSSNFEIRTRVVYQKQPYLVDI